MNKKYLNVKLYLWLLFVLCSSIFIMFPKIDIFVASLFFNGESFFMNGTTIEGIFYYSVRPIIIILVLSTLSIYAYNHMKKKNILNVDTKVTTYIILVLSIAPAFIVNSTLKEHWGRARPAQIVDFKGQKEFTPAFFISNQDGYSFSSGHSAAAFSLLGFALLIKNNREFFINSALIYGATVSLARMSAGAHFLSDVVISFFIVYFATHILYKVIFKEDC